MYGGICRRSQDSYCSGLLSEYERAICWHCTDVLRSLYANISKNSIATAIDALSNLTAY